MDKNGTLGQILEQGKASTQSVVTDAAKTVKNQLVSQGESSPDNSANPQTNQNTASTVTEDAQAAQRNREVVNDFYAPSDPTAKLSDSAQADKEKLAKLRSELHQEIYYDPLFAYEKKKPEPTKAEEAEEEKQQKMQDLALDQNKKDADISVQRAQTTTEVNRGISG